MNHIKEKFSQIEKEMLIVMEEYVSKRDELEKKYKEEVDKFQKRIKDLQLECPHNVQYRFSSAYLSGTECEDCKAQLSFKY